MGAASVELTRRALRDLRRLDRADRRRIAEALEELATGDGNLDVKPLVGRPPYLRLRVGDWRVLYRRADPQEAASGGPGWYVLRIINRRDLERAARSL